MSRKYYQGEDQKGDTTHAYTDGPEAMTPEMVCKTFGLKNVHEIDKKTYDQAMNPKDPAAPPPGGNDGAPPKETGEHQHDPLTTLTVKELKEYGDGLGLEFPKRGMKKDDMIAAIRKKMTEIAQMDEATQEPRKPEEMNEYGDEPTDPPEESTGEEQDV